MLGVALLASACAGNVPTLERIPQTTVLDKLNTTDLSARGPRFVKASNPAPGDAGGAMRTPRLFPGNDADTANTPVDQNFSGLRSVGDGYELNFENANLSDTVKVILGETLRKPYVFDPRLQGQVTLSTGRPVSESELLTILEIVLQINNASLVLSEGKYRIMPASAAINNTKQLVGLTAPGAAQRPGYGVSVLPLRHISASQMLNLIDGFLAQAGSVRADISRNLLLLRGTGPERRTLLDVATSFDLDWLKGQAAGIFPLNYATAEEIIPELNKILDSEKGGRGSGTIKFEAIKRLNAVLVLAQRNAMLKTASNWIKRLDRTNNEGINVYVYNVQHSKADRLAKILNATFGSGGDTATSGSDVSPGKAKSTLSSNGASGFNKGDTSEVSRGQTAGANDANNPDTTRGLGGSKSEQSLSDKDKAASADSASSQPGTVTGEIRVVPDVDNNTLLIRARVRDYRRILKALRGLDRPPIQIMINATIAEVALNDNLRYGVQFFLRGKKWGGVNVADLAGLPLQQAFPGLNFVLGSMSNPKVVLDALSSVTNVQVVSSPSVVVLDNQEAKLKVGAEVPVITQQSTSLDSADTRVVNAVQFRDTGVILNVIPRVSSSGLVTMEVQQEISAVAPSSAPGSLTPTINQRRINSTIAVYSGQTVLLGGLISEEDSREKDRVPIVKQLPILGELLGQTDTKRTRTELIVFIRPQVIRDGHDASMAAQELASRLRLVEPPSSRQQWLPPKRSFK
jgi:general secretion pathway protein D